MEYEIKPYIGIGSIKFGMTSEEIRTIIGGEVHQFKKSPYAEMLADDFNGKGIHVFYKEPGVCEAIEFGWPSEVTFLGNILIGRPFAEVIKIFEKMDKNLDIDETGFTSYKFGIGAFVPTLKKSNNEPVQGIIIFEKGYYD